MDVTRVRHYSAHAAMYNVFTQTRQFTTATNKGCKQTLTHGYQSNFVGQRTPTKFCKTTQQLSVRPRSCFKGSERLKFQKSVEMSRGSKKPLGVFLSSQRGELSLERCS